MLIYEKKVEKDDELLESLNIQFGSDTLPHELPDMMMRGKEGEVEVLVNKDGELVAVEDSKSEEPSEPEYKPAELKCDIAEKEFIAGGDFQEFTFSTVANDDAGIMVYGGSDFGLTYEDSIEALEYKYGDLWVDMKGQSFGGKNGFPLTDATSTFRAKFIDAAAGTYTFTAFLKKAEDDSELCNLNVEFMVK